MVFIALMEQNEYRATDTYQELTSSLKLILSGHFVLQDTSEILSLSSCNVDSEVHVHPWSS